ncbi:MAG: hypothetical protein C4K58_08285 [Flavobacteriaceae bacterium]|nr:MAG: hypothetical protein C4K58_08285 [Flavobacteriaceae bacterium]
MKINTKTTFLFVLYLSLSNMSFGQTTSKINKNNDKYDSVIVETVINATPEKVWSLLTNWEVLPTLSESLPYKKIEGGENEGDKLSFYMKSGSKFKINMLKKVPNQSLHWGMDMGNIFAFIHGYDIIDNHDGTVTFHQEEKYFGIVKLTTTQKMMEDYEKTYIELNNNLKALAEKD